MRYIHTSSTCAKVSILIMLFSFCTGAGIVTQDLQQYGVVLIPADGQDYAGRFRRILAGRDGKALEPWLPYSVIVENRSSSPIAVLTVHAELLGRDGRTVTHQMTLQHLDLENPSGFFLPGQSRFLSAVPQVDQILASRHALDLPSFLLQRIEERRALYASQLRVTFILECVVFSDGRLVGPDRANIAARIGAINLAEKEVLDRLAKADVGLSEARSYLTEILNSPEPVSTGLADINHHDRARRQFSRWLLVRLSNTSSSQELRHLISGLASKPRIAIRKVD